MAIISFSLFFLLPLSLGGLLDFLLLCFTIENNLQQFLTRRKNTTRPLLIEFWEEYFSSSPSFFVWHSQRRLIDRGRVQPKKPDPNQINLAIFSKRHCWKCLSVRWKRCCFFFTYLTGGDSIGQLRLTVRWCHGKLWNVRGLSRQVFQAAVQRGNERLRTFILQPWVCFEWFGWSVRANSWSKWFWPQTILLSWKCPIAPCIRKV